MHSRRRRNRRHRGAKGCAMQLGIVGLGRMGAAMRERLRRGGHEVTGFDLNAEVSDVASLRELVAGLATPRVVWLMAPAGEATEALVGELAELLGTGDVLVDGGNSLYKDSIRRGEMVAERGIRYLDAGVSGGVWGLENGFCVMVGGDRDAFEAVEPAIATLAPEDGYLHVGPSGAGHYVKMIHNGIEYGLMQAYAEGFDLLRAYDEDLDLGGIAELWQHGSVVRSWLLELAGQALTDDPGLDRLQPYVEDSGEGRWTAIEAVERGVPAGVITGSLFARFASRDEGSFGLRMLAALRQQFGGHAVREA
ncbi:MAG: decarboxylating 6-phosphogluconate dehydrogenase [Chloroflexi bacterium]|nr:decarboxylating 6-phosphogluconate dehydrogenase [Chloroflexota bacterium]